MQQSHFEVLQRLGLATLEAIDAGGDTGAPGGVLYAAMMAHGASLSQFQSFMDTLRLRGFVTVNDTECYHITSDGLRFMATLQAKFGAQSPVTAAAG